MNDGEPKAPYCGNPAINLGNLFRSNPGGGVLELFKNRRVSFSFNARTAIRQACSLLGLQNGDEILVPAYNCGSEIDPLFDAGLSVQLYPVGDDLRVNSKEISKRITPATKAVYITHYFGFLQENLSEIRSLCDVYGLKLIEDCALSLLSGEAPVDGRTGDVSIFCFYKFFPVFGGGALVVNAPELPDPPLFSARTSTRYIRGPLFRSFVTSVLGAERVSSVARSVKMQLRALTPPASACHERTNQMSDIPAEYYFDTKSRNTGMSILTRRMLGAFDVGESIKSRCKNWSMYAELLKNVPNVDHILKTLPENICPLGYPVIVPNRDTIVASLQELGISVTPWWAGFHKNVDWTGSDSAIRLKHTTILLPLHTQMGERHICFVSEQLQKEVKRVT